jgi:hypothetical protein
MYIMYSKFEYYFIISQNLKYIFSNILHGHVKKFNTNCRSYSGSNILKTSEIHLLVQSFLATVTFKIK